MLFMICCDGCEEWFHGKCVGITKALGQQMESKGIEWSCPNCAQAKAQNIKVQENSKPATTAPSTKLSSGQQTISSLECIVCKKPAKVDSNYCTDLCVRKHALTMLALLKKETEGLQLSSRVVVYEKKSGKLLAGNAAPTVQILADWLLEHQTYEIAKPSVLPPNKFYKKPVQAQSQSPEAVQQKQSVPSKQAQDSTPPKLPSTPSKQLVNQAKQGQPKASNQLKQQLLPQTKQAQQQQLPQVKQQPAQAKQPQQQLTQSHVKPQQSAAKPTVTKQGGNEKGGNLKQAVLTQKITPSGTKEIGFAPKPSTPHKIQIIQAQPMTVPQPTPKVKGKEEDEGKTKKSAAKIIAQSPTEAVSKRPSVDAKKPIERSASREDKRRDSVSSTKDKDEKKKEEKKKRKDSTSETTKPSEENTPAPSTQSVEPVRANVKRTLQELLNQRVKQDDSVSISNDEIKELVTSIEEELFALFKDTGTKYKSKYRSLVFNIKDPKNLTLYKKIVEKSISPTQLVRLSPEELASQELAQWREKEAKHQLEIIKKNELDLIYQAKTVVLKSRKGEEVIETKAINISELESALNRTADDYELEKTMTSETKEEEKSPEKKNDKKKEEHSSRSSDRKKKKEDRSRRDRSRSRRRSRSRSRERDKKRKEKDEKPKEKEKRDDKAEETLKEIEEVISQHISIPPPPPSQPDSDLSDREPSSTVNITTPPLEEEKTPVWRGILNMSEVTKLYTSAYEVSGSCEDLGEELADQLDCVGRIQPDSVWEYVSRMKKAGTKDIIVIRFHSDAEEEKMNYLSLYSYLNSRNRMAVIGQVSKTVKDFYVLPLASHSPIPQVLLPLDGPGFDDYRTHLLLGIIIRTKKGSTSNLTLSTRSKKSSTLVSSSSNRLERSYTPPLPADGGTPPTTPPPLPPFSKPYSHPPGLTPPLPDDDEPYSPGEDDLYSPEDNQAEAILVNPEIQRNLEEVNRMIEQKRQQIQSIAQAAAGTQAPVALDEEAPYSPSSSFTPPREGSEAIPFLDTNEIKLPPNLQDILASIKGTPTMDVKSDPIVKAYTSQAFYEEEEDLKEEEKDVKNERTSRDPRQRPDPPKPKSALSQLSDSELIRKAAEMESEEKKDFKQPAYFYAAPPPVPVAVAPQPIYPPPPTHYKYPPAPAPPPPPPVVDKERKRKDKFKERRPPPPPISHPPRRKWDNGHHNRGMMQHRPPIRGNRPPRFRGGFDRGRGGFRGGGGGFRPPRGGGGPPRFRGTHGRDRNVQSEWDEEIRNFEQRKARERKRRASRSPSPRRRSLSPPRRRSRRASSNSS